MTLPFFFDILSWILFVIGGLGVVIGAVGIVRFPDFYARLHAAGVTDTAGAELIILGMASQAPSWIVVAKLAFIGLHSATTVEAAVNA